MNNLEYQNKLKKLDIIPLEDYKNNTTPLTFKCLLCGNIFVKTPSYILKNKYKCKCSLNNKKSSIDFKEILNKLDSNYIFVK